MGSFLHLENGNVTVLDHFLKKGSVIKDIYDEDHSRGHESFFKMIRYLYFVHDKRSEFIDINLEDRMLLVAKDMISDPTYHERVEINEHFKKMLSLLNKLQFSRDEQLLEAVRKKIDEFTREIENFTIDVKHSGQFAEFIKVSEDLLKLKDRLERVVFKESEQKQVGGGEAKLFES